LVVFKHALQVSEHLQWLCPLELSEAQWVIVNCCPTMPEQQQALSSMIEQLPQGSVRLQY